LLQWNPQTFSVICKKYYHFIYAWEKYSHFNSAIIFVTVKSPNLLSYVGKIQSYKNTRLQTVIATLRRAESELFDLALENQLPTTTIYQILLCEVCCTSQNTQNISLYGCFQVFIRSLEDLVADLFDEEWELLLSVAYRG